MVSGREGSKAREVFYVASIVFVSAEATVEMLDCVSPRESCDTCWLMFCLYFNSWSSSDAGGSCWDVVLFSTLRRPKNYAWS
ncbi:hypothetical protein L3X38_005317 [Prunus dulcis]|uniref:Uncharacterized protein n=1 Tax=Prunus dulcis TaxID=3755 RepID=A0AAD5F3X7_PRUDU|nr:hypothetical protein L3X38_005317 [Prunus dulcis]